MSELSPLMTKVLQNGGEVMFVITGNSMLPLLRHSRDKVCIVKRQENRLKKTWLPSSCTYTTRIRPPKTNTFGLGIKKYDIALFVRNNGKYILHRIVAVKAEGYVVIGDNQCVKEYRVQHSQVVGIVKGIWRDGKYISCENFWYQAYCRFWVFIYPFRLLYLRAKWLFSRMNKFLGDKADEG